MRSKAADYRVWRCLLELGFLLLVAASAALGFALRVLVSVTLTRAFAVVGLAGLILGLGMLGLAATGRSPFGPWTSGLIAAALLALAGLVLPFAVVVAWGRI
ncbi:MAG TPA: hypothetical protein VFM14_09270 [Gemmatimonadales bacterium]|nr:hypothetical protein [Gemmatimonadales bacterium]